MMSRRRRERRQALTQALEGLRDTGPLNGGAAAHGRARFLHLAAALRQERDYTIPNDLAALLRGIRTPMARPWRVAVTLVTVLALLLGGTGIGVAAQDRLPGDLLYPVKTALEEGHAYLALTPASHVRVASGYADRRVDELEALLQAERWDGVPVVSQGLARWVRDVGESLERAVAAGGAEAVALADLVWQRSLGWSAALDTALGRVPASVRPGLIAAAELVEQVSQAAADVGHLDDEAEITVPPEGQEDPTGTNEPGGEASPSPSDTPAPGDQRDPPAPPSSTPEPAPGEGGESGESESGEGGHVPPGLTRTPPGLDDSVTPPGLERDAGTKLPPGLTKPKKKE